MRVTRIEVEGERTHATIRREDARIVVEVPGSPGQVWTHDAAADDAKEVWRLAECVQAKLDGFRGAGGDVREYAQLFEMLAD